MTRQQLLETYAVDTLFQYRLTKESNASESEIAAKHAEALDQLRRYAADPRIPQLFGGTPVYFIDLEFVGREMRVCEEVTFC